MLNESKSCSNCAYKPRCNGKDACRSFVNKSSLIQFKSFLLNTEEGQEFEKYYIPKDKN